MLRERAENFRAHQLMRRYFFMILQAASEHKMVRLKSQQVHTLTHPSSYLQVSANHPRFTLKTALFALRLNAHHAIRERNALVIFFAVLM